MTESIGAKIRRNTRASMMAWGWGQAIFFVRMPIYIAALGTEHYGLWMLAFTIMNYFELNNFGINTAFIKYTAQYHAQQDYRRLAEVLSTGMAAAIAIGLAGMAVLLAFNSHIIAFFQLEAENVADARFVVLGVGVATALKIAFGVYRSALTGIQRLDIVNGVHVLFVTLELVLVATLFYLGFGIRVLVLGYLLSTIGSTLAMAWYLHRLLPDVRLNPLRARRGSAYEMVSLGGRMQLLGAVALIVATIDNVFLTRAEGLAFFGAYVIAKRFASRAQSAALTAIGTLAPASADLIARKDYTRLSHVYGTAMRICCLGCAYLFGFIYVNSDHAMMLFMGARRYDPLTPLALQYLCIAVTVHTFTGPGTSMLRGAGMPLREIVYQLVTLAAFAGIFYYARAIGSTRLLIMSYPIGLAVGSTVFLLMANPFFRCGLLNPLPRMGLLLLAGPGLAWPVRAVAEWLGPAEAASRWVALGRIVIMGAPYTVLFALAAWFVPGLKRADKEQIIKFVPMGQWLMRRFLSASQNTGSAH
mgnify:CR=1 FL=1